MAYVINPGTYLDPKKLEALMYAAIGRTTATFDQWCYFAAPMVGAGWQCPAPETFGGGPPEDRVQVGVDTFLAALRNVYAGMNQTPAMGAGTGNPAGAVPGAPPATTPVTAGLADSKYLWIIGGAVVAYLAWRKFK